QWRVRYSIEPIAANLGLLAHSRKINAARRAGLQPGATDDDLCTVAKESAREAQRRIDAAERFALVMLADRSGDVRERLMLLGRCAAALDFLGALGLASHFREAAKRNSIDGALRRVVDERWWRRVLRKVHARVLEGTARALGLVHKRAGCYVSDDGY